MLNKENKERNAYVSCSEKLTFLSDRIIALTPMLNFLDR